MAPLWIIGPSFPTNRPGESNTESDDHTIKELYISVVVGDLRSWLLLHQDHRSSLRRSLVLYIRQ